MGSEAQVVALLEELALREDVPADVRERAQVLAERLRPSPESARVLGEIAELVRRLG
jgi:hypothetical protein